MNIRTLQWNIGGARIRSEDADPTVVESYVHDDLAYVIEVIKNAHPDIVTLQEVHGAAGKMQAMEIAHALGFNHVVYDVYAESHLVEGQSLGQAVISRWPIVHHSFTLFQHPGLVITLPDGTTTRMHDKGVTRCLLDADGQPYEVETVHMPPFRKFVPDVLADEWSALRADYARKLKTTAHVAMVQGDFNFDHSTTAELLPDLFADGFMEQPQEQPTSPFGKRYDHVLAKGLAFQSQQILDDVRTDHYPVVTDFTLDNQD